MKLCRIIFAIFAALASADDRLAALLDGIKADPSAAARGDKDEKNKKEEAIPKEWPMPKAFFMAVALAKEQYSVDCNLRQILEKHQTRGGIASRRKAYALQFFKLVCERFPPEFAKMSDRVQDAVYRDLFRQDYAFGSSKVDLLFQMWQPSNGYWSRFSMTDIGKDLFACLSQLSRRQDDPKAALEVLRVPKLGCFQ